MKTMKKIVAILTVALLLCSILPLSVFAADTTITFALGADGTAVHKDGSTAQTTYTETVNGYTLNITSGTKMYPSSIDAKGNGCIKLGTGSAAGGFTLTAPDDVTSVIIYAGKYKSNTTKLTVNGTSYTLTKNSNDGAYDAITVDTTSTKTITLTTVSGGYRAMINTIEFVIATAEGDCEHEWKLISTTPATCTAAGEEYYECANGCDESKTEAIAALGHSYGEATETVAPDCVNAGEKESTCSACGDVKTETVKALGHNFVDGACDVCGEVKPLEATIDFSTKDQRTEYSTTTQKWENDGLTLTNNKGGSTNNVGDYANPVRIYKSSEIIISYEGMTKLVIDANGISSNGDWSATLSAYSYTVENNIYTITFDKPTDSITLTAAAQVRANSITAYGAAPSDCDHDYVGVETQAPTCTAEGVMTYTCSKCEESYTEAIAVIPHSYVEDIIDSTCTTTGTKTYECSVCFDSYDETIPMKAHNYVDDVCADCGAVKAYKSTITFDDNKTQRTEFEASSHQKWENNGLVFVNNKASYNNALGDYSDPIRLYKGTEIIISFPEMSTLIIDASGVNDSYLWDATLEAADLNYTVANKIYTITFDEAVNSIELTIAAQARANSITAIAAHEHAYDHDFDTTCNKCDEVRAVVSPISFIAKSISEDVSGLAMLFQADVEGIVVKAGTFVQADYTNATYNGYKLLSLGVIASNGVSETNIEGVRMYNLEDGCAKFAFRVINIPADKLDVAITMTPYYVVEIEGVATTIYGEAQTGSYSQVAG